MDKSKPITTTSVGKKPIREKNLERSRIRLEDVVKL